MLWLFAALVVAGALLVMLPALLSHRMDAVGIDASASSLAVHRDQWREIERDVQAGWLDATLVETSRAEVLRRMHDDVTLDADAAPHPVKQPHVEAASDAGAAQPKSTTQAPPSTALALAIGLFVTAGSLAVYLHLGNPGAVRTLDVQAAASRGAGSAAAAHAADPGQIASRVTGLVERLKQRPDDADGWATLARSYTVLGRWRDASAAFRRASELRPGNPTLLADHADVVAMAQGRRLAGEPARLVQAALDADPRHLKALSLAGSVAFEAHDFAAAQGYWQRALDLVPGESDLARSLQGSVMQARQLQSTAAPAASRAAQAAPASMQPASVDVPVVATASHAAGVGRALRGQVELAPELTARVEAGDTVFVFARAANGPRMPLAIVRRNAGAWPLEFTLDDALAMAPDAKLSMHARVVISARVSRSGNATPQPGDLVGDGGVVAHDAQGVRIRIDRVQP